VYSLYLDPFNPTTEVLLDEPPRTPGAPLRRMGEGTPAGTSPAAGAAGQGSNGSVRAATIESYAPERVVVRATADQPGFLVLVDLFHPGWQARVDGADAELLRGNYFFRAVPLSPGTHQVEFVFDPASVRHGRLVSLAALGILAAGLVAAWRWPRRRPG
jgi:hypothetical protein